MKTVKQILIIVGISLLARTGQAFSTDSEKEIFKGDIKKQKRGWTLKVLFCCLLTVFFVGLVSSVGFATDYDWDGGDADDDNWSSAANWNLDGVPGTSAVDTATIGYVASHATITIDAAVASLTSLTIDASAQENQDITLTVSADLGATSPPSIAVNITGSGDVTINGNSNINATTITVGIADDKKTGTFTLSGAGTTTTSGAVSITSGAGDFTLDRSGVWSVGGTTDLIASGNGSITMTLGANSTFTGRVTLTAGAGKGHTTLNLGAVNCNFDGDLELASGGSKGGTPQLNLGSGSHTLAGSLTNVAIGVLTKGTSTLTFDGGTDKTLTSSGASFHNLILNKDAPGNTLTLQDALDVDGKLTLTKGTLVLGNNLEHHFAGDFEIGTNGIVTKGTGTTVLVFDGITSLTDNSTGASQNLGKVKVD